MRISDWSSDVCSSDLATFGGELGYDFGGVRVGLELAYQRNKVKGITLKSLNGTAITAEDLSDVVEGLGELDIISVDDLDGVDINGTTISATNGSVAKLRQLAGAGHPLLCKRSERSRWSQPLGDGGLPSGRYTGCIGLGYRPAQGRPRCGGGDFRPNHLHRPLLRRCRADRRSGVNGLVDWRVFTSYSGGEQGRK